MPLLTPDAVRRIRRRWGALAGAAIGMTIYPQFLPFYLGDGYRVFSWIVSSIMAAIGSFGPVLLAGSLLSRLPRWNRLPARICSALICAVLLAGHEYLRHHTWSFRGLDLTGFEFLLDLTVTMCAFWMLSATLSPQPTRLFISHGHYPEVWKPIRDRIQTTLPVECIEFNEDSAGRLTVERLDEMLRDACFGVVIMLAENPECTEAGCPHREKKRTRDNVIHECGLLQATIGLRRTFLLIEEECESLKELSNLAGVTVIKFSRNELDPAISKLREAVLRTFPRFLR